ncbi:hypothetical protein DFH09DRAFT_1070134 [Mycena vulgaris]|nr:hypothetical protein DFH09DRAFT_1070134 [Mycena vulgaris]
MPLLQSFEGALKLLGLFSPGRQLRSSASLAPPTANTSEITSALNAIAQSSAAPLILELHQRIAGSSGLFAALTEGQLIVLQRKRGGGGVGRVKRAHGRALRSRNAGGAMAGMCTGRIVLPEHLEALYFRQPRSWKSAAASALTDQHRALLRLGALCPVLREITFTCACFWSVRIVRRGTGLLRSRRKATRRMLQEAIRGEVKPQGGPMMPQEARPSFPNPAWTQNGADKRVV